MQRASNHDIAARCRSSAPLLLALLLPLATAACGGSSLTARQSAHDYAASSHDYPPPGPPEDPWGPYIREASRRFQVPEQWVRAVMHQESGGHALMHGAPITSSAGAMGLMQVMPATYDELRVQHGLGDDPFDPHNSILAGTAYIRQMYDRYGSPGFLAAYNAGPQRMDNYLAGSPLPNETVNYVASISPHLGGAMPQSGPGASAPVAYAAARAGSYRSQARRTRGCVRDPDAAYDTPCGTPAQPPQPVEVALARPADPPGCVRDPDAAFDAPCGTPARPPAPQPVVVAAVQPTPPGCVRDPDAAFDSPCPGPRPAPVLVAASEPVASAIYRAAPVPPPAPPPPAPPPYAPSPYAPSPYAPSRYAPAPYTPPRDAPQSPTQPPRLLQQPARPGLFSTASAAGLPAAPARSPDRAPYRAAAAPYATPGWGIQVGAFATVELARSTAERARREAPQLLDAAQTRVGATTPFGGAVLYRARLVGIGAQEAAAACARVQRLGTPCMTIAPGA